MVKITAIVQIAFTSISIFISVSKADIVEFPVLSPPPGQYTDFVDVVIQTETPDAIIYYTTDSSEPNENSPVYVDPIHIDSPTILYAKAFKTGWTPSRTTGGNYDITVSTPQFSPDGGTYSDFIDVTISSSTPGASIYYTIDGSEPDEDSPVYSQPVHLTAPVTLKAKAFKSGLSPSPTKTADYEFFAATPVLTPYGGVFSEPFSVSITCSSPGAVVYYTMDGTAPTENSTLYTNPILLEPTSNITLRAKAWKTGWSPSTIQMAKFGNHFTSIQNGLFELVDVNFVEYDFSPPLFWDRIPIPESRFQGDCYAGLHTSFSPGTGEWGIMPSDESGAFVMLSSGGFNAVLPDIDDVSDTESAGAILSQQIMLSEGDTIIGAYFFGTTDYMPYNDYGQISMELAYPDDFPDSVSSFVISGSYCEVLVVGDRGSTLLLSPETNGWIQFSHTVESNQVGVYNLRCQVLDGEDTTYNSYYAVDGLHICKGGRAIADFSRDCNVNIPDFAIFASNWYKTDCSESNNWCGGTDLNHIDGVEIADLTEFASYWLNN